MKEDILDFLNRHRPGLYKVHFFANLIEGKLLEEDRERFEGELEYLASNLDEGYIQTQEEFFERWMNGRLDKKPALHKFCKGFELQLPVAEVRKLDDSRTIGKVGGLVLATDLGYSGDFGNDMVFTINALPYKRVLVYQDRECVKLRKSPFGKKKLKQTKVYGFDDGQETYPFESLNPLKSADYTWSLVNIPTEDIWHALRQKGFKW